jgi:hypothetical protein
MHLTKEQIMYCHLQTCESLLTAMRDSIEGTEFDVFPIRVELSRLANQMKICLCQMEEISKD